MTLLFSIATLPRFNLYCHHCVLGAEKDETEAKTEEGGATAADPAAATHTLDIPTINTTAPTRSSFNDGADGAQTVISEFPGGKADETADNGRFIIEMPGIKKKIVYFLYPYPNNNT